MSEPARILAGGPPRDLNAGPLSPDVAGDFDPRHWAIHHGGGVRVWTLASEGVLDDAWDGPFTPQVSKTINGELYHELPSGLWIAGPPPAMNTFLVEGHLSNTTSVWFTFRGEYIEDETQDPFVFSITRTEPLIVAAIDLDAATVFDNTPGPVLDDAREEEPGAFLPVNNDDDDYDANNTADMNQTGAVAGESDLLRVTLRAIEPVALAGEYSLDIPASIRVWRQSDRTDRVLAADTFDATADTTLYIEGVTEADETLRVDWDGQGLITTDRERLRTRTFTWLGPRNVPGYSRYQYTATGGLPDSEWITGGGGHVHSGAGTTNAEYLWDEGPVVGSALLVLNVDYVWALEVNVVQVEISASAFELAGNSRQQSGLFIESAPAPPDAMTATVDVFIEGPVVDNVMRGTRFIDVGFIQIGRWPLKHGDYDFESPPAPPPVPQRRTSNLEGTDWHPDLGPGSTWPWLDTGNPLAFFSSSSVQQRTLWAGGVIDTPVLQATDLWLVTLQGATDQVDRYAILTEFRLYLAVHTTETQNSASDVYTQRASAEWWFDGSGTIDANQNWSPSTQIGVGGDVDFTIVISGDRVPVVAGPPMNDLTSNSQIWTNSPQ